MDYDCAQAIEGNRKKTKKKTKSLMTSIQNNSRDMDDEIGPTRGGKKTVDGANKIEGKQSIQATKKVA